MQIDRCVKVRSDHPMIAGHFPGNPVVPGAVLLDEALLAIAVDVPGVRRVAFAKFPTVLRPGVPCTLRAVSRKDDSIGVTCGGRGKTYLSAVLECWARLKPPAFSRRTIPPMDPGISGGIEVARLLPHAGAAVLLDDVDGWSTTAIACTSRLASRTTNPLSRDGVISAVCGVEYAAQTMAVHGALLAGGTPQPGLLVSIRDVELLSPLPVTPCNVVCIQANMLRRDLRSATYAFGVGSLDTELVNGLASVMFSSP